MPTAINYPIPRFHFRVKLGDDEISFTEVTGLVMERQKIDYRGGNLSPAVAPLVIPGQLKSSNIVCKGGTFPGLRHNWEWFTQPAPVERIKRKDVIITLLNEDGKPVAAWKALRCFPVKYTASDLKSDANETAIETLEIAHEGLSQQEVP